MNEFEKYVWEARRKAAAKVVRSHVPLVALIAGATAFNFVDDSATQAAIGTAIIALSDAAKIYVGGLFRPMIDQVNYAAYLNRSGNVVIPYASSSRRIRSS